LHIRKVMGYPQDGIKAEGTLVAAVRGPHHGCVQAREQSSDYTL